MFLPGNIPVHVYRNFLTGVLKEEVPDAIYVHNEPYALSTAQVYMANHVAGRRPIGSTRHRTFSKDIRSRSEISSPGFSTAPTLPFL